MSDRNRSNRTTCLSAVLFVVLLAATGWPPENHRLAESDRVACCEARNAAAVTRAVVRRELVARPAHANLRVALPRLPHRQRRIDCGGLPPPRAPDRQS